MDKVALFNKVKEIREANPDMSGQEAMKIAIDFKQKSLTPQSDSPKTFHEKKKAVEKFYKLSS
jgi:hypothetical protein